MKHKHYEMIVAKAANMDLVVCSRHVTLGWRVVCDLELMPVHESIDLFLCLPQHKEAVINLLNDGESQLTFNGEHWDKCNLNEPAEWSYDWWYMKGESQSRIKPKKEKRWIGVYGNHVTDGMYPTKELCERCVSRSDKFKHCAPEGWQFIEIEVEV